MVHAVTRLLLRFITDAVFRRRAFQQPRRHFDQQPIVTVDEHRQAKLPGQYHGFLFAVVQEDRCAVATVVDLSRLALPLAVVALVIEGDFLEQVPVVGQYLRLKDVDPLGCVRHDNASCYLSEGPHVK
ncbi:hypothetical protein D3C78_1509960 [compost metagenome]